MKILRLLPSFLLFAFVFSACQPVNFETVESVTAEGNAYFELYDAKVEDKVMLESECATIESGEMTSCGVYSDTCEIVEVEGGKWIDDGEHSNGYIVNSWVYVDNLDRTEWILDQASNQFVAFDGYYEIYTDANGKELDGPEGAYYVYQTTEYASENCDPSAYEGYSQCQLAYTVNLQHWDAQTDNKCKALVTTWFLTDVSYGLETTSEVVTWPTQSQLDNYLNSHPDIKYDVAAHWGEAQFEGAVTFHTASGSYTLTVDDSWTYTDILANYEKYQVGYVENRAVQIQRAP